MQTLINLFLEADLADDSTTLLFMEWRVERPPASDDKYRENLITSPKEERGNRVCSTLGIRSDCWVYLIDEEGVYQPQISTII
jgi:hypothetical protein